MTTEKDISTLREIEEKEDRKTKHEYEDNHPIKKCPSCDHWYVYGAHYCWHCGKKRGRRK